MKLLLDHCVPRRLGGLLPGHEVHTAAAMGWEELRNGRLLSAAAEAGFAAVITTDRNMKHQQNLRTLPISVVVLLAKSNSPKAIVPLVPEIELALGILEPNQLVEVAAKGEE